MCRLTCPSNEDSNTRCPLNQVYVDNSWIKGVFFRDFMALTSSGLGRASQDLGCILELSPEFKNDNNIDGIWGTGKSRQDDEFGFV